MFQQPRKQNNRKRLFATVISIASVSILLVVGIWSALSGVFRGAFASTSYRSTQNIQSSPAVSPLIFGTNLTLQDANDQFLRSQKTRDALTSIHVQLIRMPIRSVGGPAPWEVQAMQDIKQMGIIPMITLKFSQPDPAGAAKQVIQAANNVFGNGVVYYEFGNERDLAGVNQTAYTTAWNQVISQVKPLAFNGQFGGPVNFQKNPPYIAYFVHNAVPKPDFISWHEYTAHAHTTIDQFKAGIKTWGTYVTNTKAAIQANGDSVPPIFITEWNYDANPPSPDPRATPLFQQQFTQAALQEFANEGIAGAAHYVATGHKEYNLVDPSGNLTPEGQMFGNMYQSLISNGGTPPSASVTTGITTTPAPTTTTITNTSPTATPTPNDPTPQPTIVLNNQLAFSFEDGTTDGWRGHGSVVTGVQNSSAVALDGKHSLQVTLAGVKANNFPYVSIGRSGLTNYPLAGQTITAYIYLPGNPISVTAKLFVMDKQYHWFSDIMIRLSPGKWNRLTYIVPSNVQVPLIRLGVQFSTLGDTAMSTNVYIDAVGWS